MKKIPKDSNWHYLKWLGIFVVSIVLFGIINNLDKSMSIMQNITSTLSPIFMGILMAIILNIPVALFENKIFGRLTRKNGKIWSKIKRAVSISLSIACFILIAAVLSAYIIPEFARTGQGIIQVLPKYLDQLTVFIQEWVVKLNLPIEPESINLTIDTLASMLTSFLGNDYGNIFQTTITTVISVFSSVWNAILGFILAIYIVASKEALAKLIKGLLFAAFAKERADYILSVTRLSKQAFEGFITGQCIESLLIGSLTFIGMLIFRFPHPLMISCIISITAFIPIFGAVTGAIIGAVLILLNDPIQAIWFLVFILILQQVESNLLYPRIMGQQVGLPSLWVLIAVILGGEFFGIPGIILSVPLCSVLYTLLHEWILKRLREKRLCKLHSSHIPENPTPLTEEEFTKEDEVPQKEQKKNKKEKTKISQKGSVQETKKKKRSKK